MNIKNIFIISLLNIFLLSCSDNFESKEFIIHIGTTANIEEASRSNYEFDVLSGVTSQMALVSLDANGNYVPQLATYEVKDNKSYTFKIKEDAFWHDGNKVIAEDILYTLKHEDKFNNGHNFIDVIDINGNINLKKYSDYKLNKNENSITLILDKPNVRELSELVTLRILPSHIYENKENKVTKKESLIGCGPYKFHSFSLDSNTLTFVKSDTSIFNVKPDKLVFHLYKNETTLYQDLINKKIDTIYQYSTGLSKEGLNVIKNLSYIDIKSIEAKHNKAVLVFNNNFELFKDLNIKNAISYALNYESFKTLFGSEFSKNPNRSFVSTSNEYAIKTKELKKDLSKANELLNASGYFKNNKWYQKNNEILEFTLTAKIEKTGLHVRYAELVKNNLEEFGIKVNLEALATEQYNLKTSNKYSNNKISHEAAIFGFTPYGINSGGGFGSIYMDGTHSIQGGGMILDPNFKKIVNDLINSKDNEDYKNNAYNIQKYYETNIPAINLFQDNVFYAFNKKYSGYEIDSTFGITNYKTWENLKINE